MPRLGHWGVTVGSAMYRFLLRPKWIVFHIVVFAAAIGMLGLARWQWNKHLDRDAFVAKVHEREDAEPADLVALLAGKSPADIEYSRVTATGSYLTTAQLTEINRTQDGVNGVNVLTPFQVDGGPIVIVNRGFVADGTDVPPPPVGTLLVGGTARTSEVRKTGELTDNSDGATTQVRRIDLPLISRTLGLTVAPVYIDFIASKPAADSPPIPVPAPDLSGGPPHVSYTFQWVIFAICAIVGWIFAIRRSVRTRQRAAVSVSADDPVLPSA
jgi:cytochrome oxidase assembly protein ShyY1